MSWRPTLIYTLNISKFFFTRSLILFYSFILDPPSRSSYSLTTLVPCHWATRVAPNQNRRHHSPPGTYLRSQDAILLINCYLLANLMISFWAAYIIASAAQCAAGIQIMMRIWTFEIFGKLRQTQFKHDGCIKESTNQEIQQPNRTSTQMPTII